MDTTTRATSDAELRSQIADVVGQNLEEDDWYQESETEGFQTYRISDRGIDALIALMAEREGGAR